MQEYANKEALLAEIQKTAGLFLGEFETISPAAFDGRVEGVDRTPREMLAYQLGWMGLIRGWDSDEMAGKTAVTPAPGYKWNQMGLLYQTFYEQYSIHTPAQLMELYQAAVSGLCLWLEPFTDKELFEPGGRGWAQSTPSNWPVWKWVHMNTVAPFRSFRSKIRKWKKVYAQ